MREKRSKGALIQVLFDRKNIDSITMAIRGFQSKGRGSEAEKTLMISASVAGAVCRVFQAVISVGVHLLGLFSGTYVNAKRKASYRG
ncbi:MAG: hypothetical protein IPM23_00795 [Candidatus Melainabacteria bacterium]|nr:hypothetical protein [Candidatus Melainabacteria bacterium]